MTLYEKLLKFFHYDRCKRVYKRHYTRHEFLKLSRFKKLFYLNRYVTYTFRIYKCLVQDLTDDTAEQFEAIVPFVEFDTKYKSLLSIKHYHVDPIPLYDLSRDSFSFYSSNNTILKLDIIHFIEAITYMSYLDVIIEFFQELIKTINYKLH